LLIVLAFAGDSTITNDFATDGNSFNTGYQPAAVSGQPTVLADR
jgi:hypothetical protein